MEQLQTLKHGEPSWDAQVNDAINRLNDMGEVTDSLLANVTLSDNFHNDGLLALNGATVDGFYRYVQLKNAKLIEVTINVTGVKLDAWESKDVVRVPSILEQVDTDLICASGVNYIRMVGNTISVGTTQSLSADQRTVGHFVFFKRD